MTSTTTVCTIEIRPATMCSKCIQHVWVYYKYVCYRYIELLLTYSIICMGHKENYCFFFLPVFIYVCVCACVCKYIYIHTEHLLYASFLLCLLALTPLGKLQHILICTVSFLVQHPSAGLFPFILVYYFLCESCFCFMCFLFMPMFMGTHLGCERRAGYIL